MSSDAAILSPRAVLVVVLLAACGLASLLMPARPARRGHKTGAAAVTEHGRQTVPTRGE